MKAKLNIWKNRIFLIFIFISCLVAANTIASDSKEHAEAKAGAKGEVDTKTGVDTQTGAELESQVTILKENGTGTVYPVPPPFIYRGLYPCQACHRKDIRGVNSQLEKGSSFLGTYIRLANPKPRVLVKMHRNIRLKHAEWHWCLNCHSTYERNHLRLITNENISFEQSHRLCGQCHGTIYRDWKLGIHGRRVGQWDGKKLYLLCAHCHDPHKPRFRKLHGKEAPEKFQKYNEKKKEFLGIH